MPTLGTTVPSPCTPRLAAVVLAVCILPVAGCYKTTPSRGGAQAKFDGTRKVNPADVALPAGYWIEAVAGGLTFPTDLTFDDQGRLYLLESGYSYGERWATPRLLQVAADGRVTEVARGADRSGPWNGVA